MVRAQAAPAPARGDWQRCLAPRHAWSITRHHPADATHAQSADFKPTSGGPRTGLAEHPDRHAPNHGSRPSRRGQARRLSCLADRRLCGSAPAETRLVMTIGGASSWSPSARPASSPRPRARPAGDRRPRPVRGRWLGSWRGPRSRLSVSITRHHRSSHVGRRSARSTGRWRDPPLHAKRPRQGDP